MLINDDIYLIYENTSISSVDPEVEEEDLRHLFEPFGTLTELGVTLFRRESPGNVMAPHLLTCLRVCIS